LDYKKKLIMILNMHFS